MGNSNSRISNFKQPLFHEVGGMTEKVDIDRVGMSCVSEGLEQKRCESKSEMMNRSPWSNSRLEIFDEK